MSNRNFNPRAMMEKAIEVMLQSVAEQRPDGKASPKVGAVLIPPYELARQMGPLVAGCRGELREGDLSWFPVNWNPRRSALAYEGMRACGRCEVGFFALVLK